MGGMGPLQPPLHPSWVPGWPPAQPGLASRSLACSDDAPSHSSGSSPQPGSAAGKPPHPPVGTQALPPTRPGATCSQGPLRPPENPRNALSAHSPTGGGGSTSLEINRGETGEGPSSDRPARPGPAPSRPAVTYLHPSRSPCRSRPAARCSRSLRIWPRCPCTPAPRSAP